MNATPQVAFDVNVKGLHRGDTGAIARLRGPTAAKVRLTQVQIAEESAQGVPNQFAGGFREWTPGVTKGQVKLKTVLFSQLKCSPDMPLQNRSRLHPQEGFDNPANARER